MLNEVAITKENFPFKLLTDLLGHSGKACIIGYEFSWIFGVPHFRDILKGIWSELSENSRMNPFTSIKDYSLVMNWFSWRRQAVRASQRITESKSSDIVKIIKALQEEDPHITIATQCVDGLLKLNGIENTFELYGNIFQAICYENMHRYSTWNTDGVIDKPIACEICGSSLFPDVTMFGWNKKPEALERLSDQLDQSEALILIGVDKELAPFNDWDHERFVKLPIIELLEEGIVLRLENSAYMASVNDIEKYTGNKITSSNDWTLEKTINYLNQIQ